MVLKFLVAAAALLLLSACDKMQTLSEAEQIERTIRQEVNRDVKGLNALTEVAAATDYDGFAWRRGEKIQIRQRLAGELALLEQAEAPDVIATAVKHRIPSFSLVRYQQGWLVVFRTYVSSHCQVVYAYAYRGTLPDTLQCAEDLFASQANGKCQSPINDEWQVFKEWFFAESLVAEGSPVCAAKAEQGWQVPQ
ncbi:hypothetical protein SAMN06297280_1716 [Arsukibacterium tuosuense]|uniref:Uncharacterized protein n=1 Tax=Arsukibacterium tuosuense TaxID=1323745 RepID=A0A285ISG2_9GAMM|nr:hypothetical protein [Arsukibacterium tuosuense]SNY50950.1 hypothetical protein SAMN06297280_1716 [Arsukibacterium tuosuense]